MENEKKDFINYDSQDLPSEENLVPPSQGFSLTGVGSVVWAGAILVIVFLIGIVIWTFNVVFNSRTTQSKQTQNTKQLITPTKVPTLTPTPTIIIKNEIFQNATPDGPVSNWNSYTNETFNYSFRYPSGWSVKGEQDYGSYINEIAGGDMKIYFSTGVLGLGGMCTNDPNFNFGNENISVFNTPLYLFFEGDKAKNTVNSAYVLMHNYPCPNIAYFDIPEIGSTEFAREDQKYNGSEQIGIHYTDNKNRSLDEFKSTDAFKTAMKIISTFKAVN